MKLKSFLLLPLLALCIVSCKKGDDEPVVKDEPEVEEKTCVDCSASAVEDYDIEQLKCDVEKTRLDSGTLGGKTFYTENVVGIGKVMPGLLQDKGSVTKNEGSDTFDDIKSLLTYNRDELTVKKIIASWDPAQVEALTDSLYREINSIDGNIHGGINFFEEEQSETMVYFNLLNIYRFGYVELDVNDSKVNDYLVYKTNKYGDIEDDEITLTPDQFKNTYGDAFCSSLMIGALFNVQGKVFGINADSDSQEEALAEVVETMKIYLTTGTDWKDLVQESTYLKNSNIVENSTEVTGIDTDILKKHNEILSDIDELYKKGEFSSYSKGYQLYSDLYPDYNFVEVEMPY